MKNNPFKNRFRRKVGLKIVFKFCGMLTITRFILVMLKEEELSSHFYKKKVFENEGTDK